MRPKHMIWILVLVLGTAGLTSLFASGQLQHPEKAILGTWTEVSWHYEIADSKAVKKKRAHPDADNSLEHEVFSNLIIHKSEQWNFDRKTGLTLQKEKRSPVRLKWRLKGRGHILQLTYAGDTVENYQIRELTDKRMVLHFENDVHTRGIIKIVFAKKQS
jgi:hypothetical protein